MGVSPEGISVGQNGFFQGTIQPLRCALLPSRLAAKRKSVGFHKILKLSGTYTSTNQSETAKGRTARRVSRARLSGKNHGRDPLCYT